MRWLLVYRPDRISGGKAAKRAPTALDFKAF